MARHDLRHGLAMARSADTTSYATVVTYVYSPGITFGVLGPDDPAVREIDDALRIAERSGDDFAVTFAQLTLGLALIYHHTAAARDRGQTLLAEVSGVFRRRERNLGELTLVNEHLGRERARRGDRDKAIPLIRAGADHLFRDGQLLGYGIPATGVLVETLPRPRDRRRRGRSPCRHRAVSGRTDRRGPRFARHLAPAFTLIFLAPFV